MHSESDPIWWGVTQNDPYLLGGAKKCTVSMGSWINVPYLWGHRLVNDRICRALNKNAVFLYGAHKHALNLLGSSELNYSFYWVCADYKLQTSVAPNLWGAAASLPPPPLRT